VKRHPLFIQSLKGRLQTSKASKTEYKQVNLKTKYKEELQQNPKLTPKMEITKRENYFGANAPIFLHLSAAYPISSHHKFSTRRKVQRIEEFCNKNGRPPYNLGQHKEKNNLRRPNILTLPRKLVKM
jgi:hypothetical protein